MKFSRNEKIDLWILHNNDNLCCTCNIIGSTEDTCYFFLGVPLLDDSHPSRLDSLRALQLSRSGCASQRVGGNDHKNPRQACLNIYASYMFH